MVEAFLWATGHVAVIKMAGDHYNVDEYALPLWSCIPLNKFRRPTEPAKEALRRSIARLKGRLFSPSSSDQAVISQSLLSAVPIDLLNEVAPEPDESSLAEDLERDIPFFSEKGANAPETQVVVSAPFSGVREALIALALRKGFRTLGAPTAEDILSGAGTGGATE